MFTTPSYDNYGDQMDIEVDSTRKSSASTVSASSIAYDKVFFSAGPEQIRGAAASDVLRGGAHVMRNDGAEWWATQDIYERRSQPRPFLHAFLSHVWGAPRWNKFLQLVLVFNLRRALVISFAGMLIGALLNLWNVVPAFPGFMCSILALPTFYAALFLWDDITRYRCRTACTSFIFLDKYCINQVSPEEKMKGIAALGAIIRKSERMVVLHSQDYFRRLWTIFEIAAFLSISSMNRLLVIPSRLPKIIIIMSIAQWGSVSGTRIMGVFIKRSDADSNLLLETINALILWVAWTIAFDAFRRLEQDWQTLLGELSTFDIKNAQCKDESDRVIVEQRVDAFQKVLGRVPEEAAIGQSLDSFNSQVRNELIKSLRREGSSRLSYSQTIAIMWAFAATSFDELSRNFLPTCAGIHCPTNVYTRLCGAVTLNCCTLPLLLALLNTVARRFPMCSPRRGWLLALLIGAVFVVILFLSVIFNMIAFKNHITLSLTNLIVQGVITVICFAPRRRLQACWRCIARAEINDESSNTADMPAITNAVPADAVVHADGSWTLSL